MVCTFLQCARKGYAKKLKRPGVSSGNATIYCSMNTLAVNLDNRSSGILITVQGFVHHNHFMKKPLLNQVPDQTFATKFSLLLITPTSSRCQMIVCVPLYCTSKVYLACNIRYCSRLANLCNKT